jgi:quercetin dioxygenase-like cupin family protein
MKRKSALVSAVCLSVAILLGAGLSLAQQSGIKRTLLLKQDISAEGREVVMGKAEIAAGGAAGKHYHHGEEVGYVLEGESVIEIEGQAPLTLKAGQSYSIPAGKVHDAKATGGGPVTVLAVYIVEKGKPLAEAVK